MDYAVRANVRRHPGWDAFRQWSQIGARRLVLLTTAGATPLPDFAFAAGDVLLFGSERAGVPHPVHAAAAPRVALPLQPRFRSLTVAFAAVIALAEPLRQTNGFPEIGRAHVLPPFPHA